MANHGSRPERPRSEPEIIPPGAPLRPGPSSRPPYTGTSGRTRIYVARVGPLGFTLLMLAITLLGAAFLVAFIGAFLLWIPIVAVIVIIAGVARLFARP